MTPMRRSSRADCASPDQKRTTRFVWPSRETAAKLALVIEHLQRRRRRDHVVDLRLRATGWLPHTTRAALPTGLRKRGYAVIREQIGAGDPVYRISDAPAHRGRCYPTATRRRGRLRAQAEGDASGVVMA